MKLVKLIGKFLLLPFTLLARLFSLVSAAPAEVVKPKAPFKYKEPHFIALLHNEHAFKQGDTIVHRFRPDLYKGEFVVEVDWEDKMYEGLGQALTYSYYTDMKPGLVILDDVAKNVNFQKFLEVFDHHNVKVWVVEVNRTEGTILNITERK